MDNVILEIHHKLREKNSTEVLEGIHLTGQLAELPDSLLKDLLELLNRDYDNFI
jgi:hypothetical protein